MSHKINMGQGAIRIMRDIIAGTGWAKTTSHIVIGGGLLSRLPEIQEPPAAKDDVTAWGKKPVPEFEITEKERDACKVAIDHFAGQGAIPPNVYSAELLRAFGYE